MRIHNDAWIVRWAYLFDKYTPRRTSLCAFFWRCVLLTPLICSMIATVVVGVMAALYIALIVKDFWWVATIAAIAIGAWYLAHKSGALKAAKYYVEDRLDAVADSRPAQQAQWAAVVLWRGAKALKTKMCPVIELSEIEPDDINEAPNWA